MKLDGQCVQSKPRPLSSASFKTHSFNLRAIRQHSSSIEDIGSLRTLAFGGVSLQSWWSLATSYQFRIPMIIKSSSASSLLLLHGLSLFLLPYGTTHSSNHPSFKYSKGFDFYWSHCPKEIVFRLSKIYIKSLISSFSSNMNIVCTFAFRKSGAVKQMLKITSNIRHKGSEFQCLISGEMSGWENHGI
jgi:hypothetical protein